MCGFLLAIHLEIPVHETVVLKNCGVQWIRLIFFPLYGNNGGTRKVTNLTVIRHKTAGRDSQWI